MEVVNKPLCKFGVKCYRKNPKHFDAYSHPEKPSKQTKVDGSTKNKVSRGNHSKQIKPTSSKRKGKYNFSGSKVTCETESKNSETERCDNESAQSMSFSSIQKISSSTGRSHDDIHLQNKTVEEKIKILFLVDMPPDFYSFFEFFKTVEETHQLKALELAGLKLVGPFDILSGEVNHCNDQDLFLCHWRYYYDPPEFQTVLSTDSGFHIGYWRDSPTERPVFLASNNPNKGCVFKVEAENIFGSVYHYLNDLIKGMDPFKKVKIAKLQTALSSWAKKNKFSLEKETTEMEEREKKVVSKTFHGAGIVVPVEAKTDVGYRPLIETNENLKRICELIMAPEDNKGKEAPWENLQRLINAANIANDECDFGNSLELGIDLFCMGSPVFHETVEHLLSNAYSLLNRTEFEKIIKAHLKFRRKGDHLSACG